MSNLVNHEDQNLCLKQILTVKFPLHFHLAESASGVSFSIIFYSMLMYLKSLILNALNCI